MPEERAAPHADPLFATRAPSILDIWDQMQRLQTDFALPQELTFYYTSPHWQVAKRILDLGTGNGYYLSKIAARFPGRAYHGVDSSTELIAIAEKEAARGQLSFSHGTLFDVTEPFDFVLMRLLLQHLDDIPAVLDHVATLTTPGHAALIIDADDLVRFFHPELPEFTRFCAAYSNHERKAGRERRVAARVEHAITSGRRWTLGGTLQLLIPSTIPGNLDLFTRTYALLVDLVEQAGELDYDFASVKRAWRQWSARPDAYTQVGLYLIRIDRV